MIPTLALVAIAVLISSSAAKPACSSATYQAYLSLSAYAPAEDYCSASYLAGPVTVTITTRTSVVRRAPTASSSSSAKTSKTTKSKTTKATGLAATFAKFTAQPAAFQSTLCSCIEDVTTYTSTVVITKTVRSSKITSAATTPGPTGCMPLVNAFCSSPLGGTVSCTTVTVGSTCTSAPSTTLATTTSQNTYTGPIVTAAGLINDCQESTPETPGVLCDCRYQYSCGGTYSYDISTTPFQTFERTSNDDPYPMQWCAIRCDSFPECLSFVVGDGGFSCALYSSTMVSESAQPDIQNYASRIAGSCPSSTASCLS